MYLVFTLLGAYVKTEIHSASGRCDCIVETSDYVYVMEFKTDSEPEKALAQIEEKQYKAELLARGIPGSRTLKYGFAFQGKECLIRKRQK